MGTNRFPVAFFRSGKQFQMQPGIFEYIIFLTNFLLSIKLAPVLKVVQLIAQKLGQMDTIRVFWHYLSIGLYIAIAVLVTPYLYKFYTIKSVENRRKRMNRIL
jgi:hypothetical protein